MEISKLLNTGLDAETLAVCVRLCENGVNPDALAMAIQELRRETAALKVSSSYNNTTHWPRGDVAVVLVEYNFLWNAK